MPPSGVSPTLSRRANLFEAAAAHGGAAYPATKSTLEGGVEVVYLTDPDGTRIECMAGVPDLAG